MPEQDPIVRKKNFIEVPLGYTSELAMAEANRCLLCKKPLCIDGCPVNVKIPEFVELISHGKFSEAAAKLKENNSLPAICGRVCPQEEQCEQRCILAKKGEPLAIGNLERFAADWELDRPSHSQEVIKRNGKKVAIVGSGPAGLTAAGDLIRIGFDVTIFEALHQSGGVLVYGIPEFRLPKTVVETEINSLLKLGVILEKNVVIGKTITVDELLGEEGFSAVFIGSGAGLPSFLDIPGENAIGVYSANEYLTRVNLMRAFAEDSSTPIIHGKTVITIGGGNVAMDAARTALRLGAEHSIIVYRRTEAEMPARTAEIHHAKQEGIEFCFLSNPTKILMTGDGHIGSLCCTRMELGQPDSSGRRRPIEIPDSQFEIPADVIVVAIGNRPNPLIPNSTNQLEVTKHGTIVAGATDGRTSRPYVYAGGDIVTGAATVILAMGAGKIAARSIAEDLLK